MLRVKSFDELIQTPFEGGTNAMGWERSLQGDFQELVNKLASEENIHVVELEELRELQLSHAGNMARELILSDMKRLKDIGADPSLNIITHYEKDEEFVVFPTDVYSFHVDRSPIPTSTFLCTYFGATSEILPNADADQKIQMPEFREALRQVYDGNPSGFDDFLKEHFFDLHYQPKEGAQVISLPLGQIWRLAVDHPESAVLPCLHRAPLEKPGEKRLLLIC
ncbi:MAG: hypothetical protein EP332_07080 [Bacteroidetes bacterium]|nr:MAG: hypothetical protein EP332_07080 [Bacteroidota bacterium]